MDDANEGWQKVETGEVWDFEKNAQLTGVYVLREENVGPNASNLYHIELENGQRVTVWGNTILDNRFETVDIGLEVKIIYYGMVKSEKTGRSYRNFDLFYRKAAFKKAGGEETPTPKPPAPESEEKKGELTGPEEKVGDEDLPF